MNYNREGFVRKTIVFPEISCSFFLALVDLQPGRTFYVLLLGEHIQWV
ncbi:MULTISPECIES: hypothetical protein [Bacillus]|uniref:Uncharacterized protein n=2 Tax=Bacillus subtilis TaxID=1423 RepID=A0AAQ3ES56_BACIU|nr:MULTISPECIES: hypothetical protein [Bacillus]KIL32603.1 hypothetical protein B4067_3059 [Bacillus subtilis subsp. subtilis]MBO3764905.1 hypothetical protein [Bacillus subtilis]MBP3046671.1 hypothetical protein [Bacillus subtilis subsp. subtilis]MDP8525547.1 hypothetical protein [Bacillus subtilis]MEC1958290.1 hypothetical protein [Bacillus subtilis]